MDDLHIEPIDSWERQPDSDNAVNDAFLIKETHVTPLIRSIVNIGRRHENDVVIDDPRVSRSHAQLRLINGQYILFDLNSTGGTFVNGRRIDHIIVYSGDVISFAGVDFVFKVSGTQPRPDLKETDRF